ncbi:MAG: hypothetical protein NTV39_02670 [Candidatus Saccharibacteria bacterium]|nr:hypothetical protein [Candidatus Saccharibacteria bacterium]
MENHNTDRIVKRRKQNIPESFIIIRILSIILVFIVLEYNFIKVWSLSIIYLLILLAAYTVFIFYPRKVPNKTMDIVKFGLGIVSLFVGLSLFFNIVISIIKHDFPFNVGVFITVYSIFWLVVGYILIIKSRHINIVLNYAKKQFNTKHNN